MLISLSSLLRKTYGDRYPKPQTEANCKILVKLRQIARFSSNVILDEISYAKCCLLFGIYILIAQHGERPLYLIHMVTSRFLMEGKRRLLLLWKLGNMVFIQSRPSASDIC